jgi:hypothetical protein
LRAIAISTRLGRPGGGSRYFPGGIIDDVALAGHHDVGRRIAFQHARLDRLVQRAPPRLFTLGQAAALDLVPTQQFRQMRHDSAVFAPLEDAVPLVDRGEQVAVLGDVLGRAEE